MQKDAHSHFDVQTGRVVRHIVPQAQGKKRMSNVDQNGSESGEAKAKRTGNKVQMLFLNEKGDRAKHPAEGTRKVLAELVQIGEQEVLDLAALEPEMLYRLAAFGASVLGRNEVNTTPTDEGAETAAENLRGRWEGFRQNQYRSVSSGSATPVILLALERALRESGNYDEEVIAEKVNSWRAKYDDGEDEDAQKKSRTKVLKELRGVAAVRAAEKTIQQERQDARLAAAPQKDLGDL